MFSGSFPVHSHLIVGVAIELLEYINPVKYLWVAPHLIVEVVLQPRTILCMSSPTPIGDPETSVFGLDLRREPSVSAFAGMTSERVGDAVRLYG